MGVAPGPRAPEPIGWLTSTVRLATGLAVRAWGRTITGTQLWRVALRGENCLLEDDQGTLESYRFTATRWVRARRRASAERAALGLIAAELAEHAVRIGEEADEARVHVVEATPAGWPEERLVPGRAIAWFREGRGED